MRAILLSVGLLFSHGAPAQIAPECAGVEKSPDYDEDKQRAFMQNHAMSMFMPLPIIDSHPSDQRRAAIGIDTTLVPTLTCRQRLALGGTKTEDTNKIPLLPRPHLGVSIFKTNHFAFTGSVSFLPPLIPKLLLWHVATEGSFLYEPIKGVVIGSRAFIGLGYVRAEIATPFETKGQTKEDWFSFALIGGDITASFRMPITEHHKLSPFFSCGLVKGASLFVVADDGVPVTNKYPLFSFTNFVGFSYQLFDSFNAALAIGGALNTSMTGSLRLAYLF